MNGLFDFLSVPPPISVAHDQDVNGAIVDTTYVHDKKLYETGVLHPDYNMGKWVIVEEYDTQQQAKEGHAGWVRQLTKELPEVLRDVSHTVATHMLDALEEDGTVWRERHRRAK